MTAAVAGPTPETVSSSLRRARAAMFASLLATARHALMNARSVNLLSPWISRSVPISSRTIATACLSIPDFRMLREEPEAARDQLQYFARSFDPEIVVQLAAWKDVREIVTSVASLSIAP